MKIIKLVCVSDKGQRVGEDGASAKLSNKDAMMVRELHFDYGISERQIAAKFEVSRRCIRQILQGKTYPEIFNVVKREITL